MAKADDTGYSASAMCLHQILAIELPARRRLRHVNEELLSRVLFEIGKIGNNINQIAHHLNAGRPGDVTEASIEAALAELMEWRTALMQSLGLERDRELLH